MRPCRKCDEDPMRCDCTLGVAPLEEWECGHCHKMTNVRHFLQRGGVMVHDPDAAFREVVGLDQSEPDPTAKSSTVIGPSGAFTPESPDTQPDEQR